MENRACITGVVLAGGLGRRMGGVDKGLVEAAGRPLVSHVLATIAPQVSQVMINANRHHEEYASLGYPVISDVVTGSAGPLAGFHAALRAASTPLVLMVPCDTPALPATLVEALWTTLTDREVDIAYASDHERAHPAVVLMKRELADDLEQWLVSGGRKIDQWYARHPHASCHFDDARAFININTLNDRDAFGQ
ncbi:molybdenum cofactor guanylyltransferase MobA [Kushneria indalinina]|uniref:Molybdenum cofactor guanylyltransferase n=1 Tax=Kushneria indalinina DSM 14324 TaxID=1122140 RepID=A0A3D9E035_9GAMM|nr:molybdenum cofactor guanylyltransferase MobA [Kushneria indalinina]REC96388.1 molybdenum cofactor guanylyltransferase [Kushneria indalinina DSM 14324]